jgi:hypothetical protein
MRNLSTTILPPSEGGIKPHTQFPTGFAVFDSLAILRTISPSRVVNLAGFKYDDIGRFCREDWLNIRYTNQNGYHKLRVEFQMPRALGNAENLYCAQAPEDITEALELVNEKVSSIIGLDCRLAEFGSLALVDANRDFSLPDKAERLALIQKSEVSRMQKTIYPTGVRFENKFYKIKVYDKFAQIDEHQHLNKFLRDWARTLLRCEARLEKRTLNADIKEFFANDDSEPRRKYRTPGEILTPEFASFIVNHALRKIEVDMDLMTFESWSEMVRQNFRRDVAAKLIGFMQKIQKRGASKVRGKSKKSQNAFGHRQQQLKEEGLWFTTFAPAPLSAMTNFPNDDESFYW